jgi:hypothetical protein
MSKSNDSSKLGSAPQVRELRDDELENVSGGINDFAGTYVPFAGDGLGASHSLMGGYKTAASEGWGN